MPVFWVVAPCSLVEQQEDSHLHTCRRESLKPHTVCTCAHRGPLSYQFISWYADNPSLSAVHAVTSVRNTSLWLSTHFFCYVFTNCCKLRLDSRRVSVHTPIVCDWPNRLGFTNVRDDTAVLADARSHIIALISILILSPSLYIGTISGQVLQACCVTPPLYPA
jgi:hypothetical protein